MKSIDKWFVCGWVAVLFVSILACSSGDPDEPDPISSMDVCGGIVGQICTVDGEVCFFEESQNCGQFDQQGTCELPPEFCTKEYFPVCGCDGKTYGNACMARAAGASVEQQGECPPVIGQICGTRGAQPCPTGQVCFWDSSANCGRTDQAGYCDIAPTQCYLIHRPVCGCDGQTYGNDCLAHAAGVSIDYDGACQSGNACGSRGLAPCPSGEFCNYPTTSLCGRTDLPGACETIPQFCTQQYDPVCGCDGQTYSNACTANGAGVSVEVTGACGSPS